MISRTKDGLLISFFATAEDGVAAYHHLVQNRFRRVALVHSDSEGKLNIRKISSWHWILIGILLGFVLGGVVGGIIQIDRLVPISLSSVTFLVLPGLVGAITGGSLGWGYVSLLRSTIDRKLIDSVQGLLVPGETVVVVQTSPEWMDEAFHLLPELAEFEPSIFVIHPKRKFEIDLEQLKGESLSSRELKEHASHIATTHLSKSDASRNDFISDQLLKCEDVIESIRSELVEASHMDLGISTSAEWILDNAYIIQRHINDVRRNLSKKFYSQLPIIRSERGGVEPRIYRLAVELIMHTDHRLDRHNITDFLEAYQSIIPLTIGELWAFPLMLRVVLINGIRQLAELVSSRLHDNEKADFWSNRLRTFARRYPDHLFSVLDEVIADVPDPSVFFATQLIGNLYDEEVALLPTRSWLERKLSLKLYDIDYQEQTHQAVDQNSIGNAITSLRQLAQLDWREIFEIQNRTEAILRQDPSQIYSGMDFETRDSYRRAVEELATCSDVAEDKLAEYIVDLASDHSGDPLHHHVGYYLFNGGRFELIKKLVCRDQLRNRILAWIHQHHTSLYLSSVSLITLLAIGTILGLYGLSGGQSILAATLLSLTSILPASQIAILSINYVITRILPPRSLPKMSFEDEGIPDEFRTLVIVPVMLVNLQSIREEVTKLEIRYLANPDPNLMYGLFSDFMDAPKKHMDSDEALLQFAIESLQNLNRRHGENRFFLLHRNRTWVESENAYIGWERKRGKLEDLNRIIVGEPLPVHRKVVHVGEADRLKTARFVITLDSDTQLPNGSARRMVETLAHPLNQPRLSSDGSRICEGYAILQPRVSTALPSAVATRFSRYFTDPVGSDPYTRAVSDVYQDLSGEGSYQGKGIYDPRVFHQLLQGKFPQGRILSHDLIEGAHMRVGLASDIELFDDFPSDYLAYTSRQHRWIRGDWQISDWITPWVPGADGRRRPNGLNAFNRWKVFDNLRRSLVPPAMIVMLFLSWILTPMIGAISSLLIALLLLFRPLSSILTWISTAPDSRILRWKDLRKEFFQAFIEASLIPHQAGLALDAIGRVWFRRLISGKHLLQWTTAQITSWQVTGKQRLFFIHLGLISAFSIILGISVGLIQPQSLYPAATYLFLWFFSPILAWWLNIKPPLEPKKAEINESDIQMLRRIARETWRFYDDFVDASTHWLPPDNYQISHRKELAMRTSPTNIGLWLLAALGSHDFGYLTGDQVVQRVSYTFETFDQLERFEGHLLNWYELTNLNPLPPKYVSTVDSGNFLGSLWVLDQGIQELIRAPILGRPAFQGMLDTVQLASMKLDTLDQEVELREPLAKLTNLLQVPQDKLLDNIDQIRRGIRFSEEIDRIVKAKVDLDSELTYWLEQIRKQFMAWALIIDRYFGWVEPLASIPQESMDFLGEQGIELRQRALTETPSLQDLTSGNVPIFELLTNDNAGANLPEQGSEDILKEILDHFSESQRLAGEMLSEAEDLILKIRDISQGMDLQFLYDEDRRLFSIGYNLNEQQLDGSYYDLLASESRLASFMAIARNEVPSEHWFALSRPYSRLGDRLLLLSWTGTMFEYLMPLLLQRVYDNSLLDMAAQNAVAQQIDYGQQRGVPWGISESAYSDLDNNRIYQYKAFGVPDLGLKRGLRDELVVAPYATLLALLVDSKAAIRNLKRLDQIGLHDTYGYYDAIDFSRRRSRDGKGGVPARTYMAHHQAMGFLAIDSLVNDQPMQRRFHSDVRVRAAEPLLYERIPAVPPLNEFSTSEHPGSPALGREPAPSVSKFDTPHTITPKTQLLSNGEYSLMVTSAGGGYSRWRDFDITRWRTDTTCDDWGTFCYIRDTETDLVWSSAYQPIRGKMANYAISFSIDRAEIRRLDDGIETQTVITVSPEDHVEIRRITVINRSNRPRKLELTSYAELALAPHAADRQHPAFNKIFIQTEAVPELGSLLASRRPREADAPPIWVGHTMSSTASSEVPMQYETDRRRFIGRGHTLADPVALREELSNTAGQVLDPILSLREEIVLEPRGRKQIFMILGAAESRDQILNLLQRYQDPQMVERALDLAWVQSQVELRQLRIQPDDARRYQQLASYLLYPSPVFRPPGELLRQNNLDQSRLWPYGISGDLPITAITIAEARDLNVVRQVLQAHTYWRLHGLSSDLVVLNEESTSYDQPLNEELKRLIQTQLTHVSTEEPDGIFLLNVDQIPKEDLTLLYSVARISLIASRGSLPQQLVQRSEAVGLPKKKDFRNVQEEHSAPLPPMELFFFNGLGGFTRDGREYVIEQGPDHHTPAPWVNVMANPKFGTVVSEAGSGVTWFGNSQQNRLTPWSNDPVSDPPSDVIFLRDEEDGRVWTPTPYPIRELDAYRTRHGAGYTVFEHNSHAIEQELITFVPMDQRGGDPLRIQRLRLRNGSSRTRHLSVTFYVEWVLGDEREKTQQHIVTSWDNDSRAILARNRYNPDYKEQVAFAAMSPNPQTYSGDRMEFIGRNGSLSEPAALNREGLSTRTGAGLDPCGALQVEVEIKPGVTTDVICLLGQADSQHEAQRLINKYREDLAVEEALVRTTRWWEDLLGTIQVDTPEPSINFILNHWLLYQTLSCRIWGRTAFYQSGGAFGFRDQLQDVMSLLYASPDLAREHILHAASRQFKEGDVQHWWHLPSGSGIRSRFSDDLLWLPYVVTQYVKVTGDIEILSEDIPFLVAPILEEDQLEVFLQPTVSNESGTLFEHCRRAIERGLTSGPHGLPLIGIGDWNDGMNRVGVEGKGESVWLAWFLISVLDGFAELADLKDQVSLAESYREKARQLASVVESTAWDGAWYRRAYFDDGTPLGSAQNDEAKIDSLPQSWAVLSGAADPKRASQALEAALDRLVLEEDQLVLLFTPPFESSDPSPGYIMGYPPGVRENGGQYTHGSLWLPMALARQGDGDRAVGLMRIMNPIEHARTPEDVKRYMVEPYVVSADVYQLPGRVGQGGWTWYTGSSGWMYRVWVEEILGLKVCGEKLSIAPVIPSSWDGFEMRYRNGKSVYEIKVENPNHVSSGVVSIELDGNKLETDYVHLQEDQGRYNILVRMGERD